MRVIAGTYRSRLLQAPRGTATRPTSDRLRETLFNVLGYRVVNSRFADLYAGSGAVGIEAVSRGAKTVYFAENAVNALAAIRSNLSKLGIGKGVEIEAGGTAALLRRLHNHSPRPVAAAMDSHAGELDVVFLDPPYESGEDYRRTMTTLGSGNLLVPGALVVAEHARREPLQDSYGTLCRARTLLQGDTALSFYAIAAAQTLKAESENESPCKHEPEGAQSYC